MEMQGWRMTNAGWGQGVDRCEVRLDGCGEGESSESMPQEVSRPSPWCVERLPPQAPSEPTPQECRNVAKGAKRSPTGINAKLVVAWI